MVDQILHFDWETLSPLVDLRKSGLHVYKDHPLTDIWLAAYAFGDGDVKTWWPGEICPEAIRWHLARGGMVSAHNATFEYEIWNTIAAQRYGFPILSPLQIECTMAMAYAMALPGTLEGAAAALGIKEQKDMDGHRVMLELCTLPQKSLASSEQLARLKSYCIQDVKVERELRKRLRALSPKESRVWRLDQEINSRGIFVDVGALKLAKTVAEQETKRLDEEMKGATGGFVSVCTAIPSIKQWLWDVKGYPVTSLDKHAIRGFLDNKNLDPQVRRVLTLRSQAGKSSVKKIDAMLGRVSLLDSRIRGTQQFHGASTGRWAGRGIQPHNLPRIKYERWQIDSIFELLLRPDAHEAIHMFHGSPLQVISSVLRAFITAPPNKTLFFGDFNAIEARVLAWLAQEDQILEDFRNGIDPYVAAYARSFHVDRDSVTEWQRQIGKVQVLALGFQGGVGAFQTMARNYGVEIPDYEAETIVREWRESRPSTCEYWRDLQTASLNAVKYAGDEIEGPGRGGVKFKKSGSFLLLKLPSGRVLTYPYPEIREREFEYVKGGKKLKGKSECLSYMAVDSKSKKWTRHYSYGGLLAENICQATARDVMVDSMLELESRGFQIVLTVHDEIVAEKFHTKIPQGCIALSAAEEMEEVMCTTPVWAPGLPVGASVGSGKRYTK